MPPSALMALRPTEPSAFAPVSTIPMARSCWSAASDVKNSSIGIGIAGRSTAGRSLNAPCSITTDTLGGITYTCPARSLAPSSMADTAKDVSLASSSGRWLSASGARWTTIAKARSCGIVEAALKNWLNAWRPPADAPIATMRGAVAGSSIGEILLESFMTRRLKLLEDQCIALHIAAEKKSGTLRAASLVSQP